MENEEIKGGVVPTKKPLPTIKDLSNNLELAFEKDKFNELLNQPPPEKWVKEHPIAKREIKLENGMKQKVPVQYIPISHIEMALTMIFQEWRVQIIHYGPLFNSVSCHIRLHYMNPVTGNMAYHDGAGAVPVQTDAGKNASDLGAIKSDAVMKALPAAKSYAVKDAADHLGKLFGRDLNREFVGEFFGKYEQDETKPLSQILKPEESE